MPAVRLERTVNAYNTAHASENKIHDNETARRFGFAGGLVPGVDVFAYMSHPAVRHWGVDWLRQGRIQARFLKPVYDGEDVDVVASGDAPMRIEVRRGDTVCGSAEAWPNGEGATMPTSPIPMASLPDERPPASPDSLAAGTVLGTLNLTLGQDEGRTYLRDVREDQDLYDAGRLAHPGWLLRRANRVLAETVRLGPWIHVSSEAQFLGLLYADQPLTVLGQVIDNYERKGHRFVDLDVLMQADDGQPVMRVKHTAIYAPRQVTGEAAAE